MATQYNFTGRSIKCTSWWQMIHLSEIASANKLNDWYLCEKAFRDGAIYFVVDMDGDYASQKLPQGEVVDYADFVNLSCGKNSNMQKTHVAFELTVGENLSEEQMSGIAKQFSQFEAPLMDMEFSVAGKPAADTNNTIEITGCKGCPLYTRLEQHDYQYCSYPKEQMATQLRVDMFANCPAKEKALMIKIKQ